MLRLLYLPTLKPRSFFQSDLLQVRKEAQMVLGISVKERHKIGTTLPFLTTQRRVILPNSGYLNKMVVG
jgi:hypothetical protein